VGSYIFIRDWFGWAARARGPRVTAVVLSGALDDGAAGAVAVLRRGGVVLAQDPREAQHSGMPLACIRATGAGAFPVREIAGRLVELTAEKVDLDDAPPPSQLLEKETDMAGMDPVAIESLDRPGHPSGFSCPDCHGVLFHIEEGMLRRFRCRVGHAWSVDSLLAQHGQAVEGALWMALRSLEEKAALCAELADGARVSGYTLTADRFAEQAGEAQAAAETIRTILVDTPDTRLTTDPSAPVAGAQ
jgi:two-component system chemotaxis response regulator CheB